MLRFKTEELYKQLAKYYDPTSLTSNELIDFCETHKVSYCILKYSEDGLYLISNGSMLRLNAESEIVDGSGEFSKFLEDDEDLYEKLKEYLDKIDSRDYDIVYENSDCISLSI